MDTNTKVVNNDRASANVADHSSAIVDARLENAVSIKVEATILPPAQTEDGMDVRTTGDGRKFANAGGFFIEVGECQEDHEEEQE